MSHRVVHDYHRPIYLRSSCLSRYARKDTDYQLTLLIYASLYPPSLTFTGNAVSETARSSASNTFSLCVLSPRFHNRKRGFAILGEKSPNLVYLDESKL